MDVVFGSQGVAAADLERMEGINREIGLDALLRGSTAGSGNEAEGSSEKNGAANEKDGALGE
jgi:hypothetical protein